jgi:hypothetical protein
MIIIIALIILLLAIWGFSPRKTIQYYKIAKNSIEYDDRKDANRKVKLESSNIIQIPIRESHLYIMSK